MSCDTQTSIVVARGVLSVQGRAGIMCVYLRHSFYDSGKVDRREFFVVVDTGGKVC